MTADVRKSKTF